MDDNKKNQHSKRGGDPKLPDQRLMEQSSYALHQLLENKEFKNMKEANEFLQKTISEGKPPEFVPHTPLEQAQAIMFEAFAASGNQRAELARKALETSADCADAYVLLAEETARNAEEALPWYRQGVEAGKRALGEEIFKKQAGHFWGIIETRPYLRARLGLAQCLFAVGAKDEAVQHYREMLKLNSSDNQGVRYVLSACLLELGRDAELERLLQQYKGDGSVEWFYARALLAFRREGESEKAQKLLEKAAERNPFIPVYLLGLKELPEKLPDLISPGRTNEAEAYVFGNLRSWRKTPGALEWLGRLAPVLAKPELRHEKMSDIELVALLFTQEDFLPREAVDEFVRRGKRVGGLLEEIIFEKSNYLSDLPEFWAPVHAAFIIGAIGGEEAVVPLIAALRYSAAYDNDWILEALPAIFTRIGRAAVLPLGKVADDPSNDWTVRAIALRGMAGAAMKNQRLAREAFSLVAGILSDDYESMDVRREAESVLLDFKKTEYRKEILQFAGEEERIKEHDPRYLLYCYMKDVDRFLEEGRIDGYNRDWLDFYREEEIEKRRRRWEEEDKEEGHEMVGKLRIGRNDPCPCGSGKKYKKCCLDKLH
ncbi:MAG: SEC-C metal-binding domain-containing protein [Proteobacteria bacterium]|nr:SEC-C metal-binding domain-containing protein [Pseudomonadota bacterium]